MIEKQGNLNIYLSMPDNDYHENEEITIVFGTCIYILYNQSYQFGFNGRMETTKEKQIKKEGSLNPSLLRDDVFEDLKQALSSQRQIMTEKNTIDLITALVKKHNKNTATIEE